MREIKFRVWVKRCYDKHEEVYIGGYMIESKFLSQIDFFNETIITCFFVDGDDESVSDEEYFDFKEVELMQYTGLKDKNGVEIYVSDIVEFEPFKGDIKRGVVKFEDGRFCVFDESNDENDVTDYSWKVIGNIYETPEFADDFL